MSIQSNDEAEIRAIVEERTKATRARDVTGATRHFSPAVLLFDVVDPLRRVGAASAKTRASEWFASFDGPIGFDVAELNVTTGEGTAFSTSLNHVFATTTAGNRLDMWWRCTTCYQKYRGRWSITHEHNSVPFNPATGEVSLSLSP